MRLIDADALKETLKSNCTLEICHDYNTAWCEVCCPHNDFEDLIDNAPTVSEITKEKLSIAYDQGYKDGRDNWLQEDRPQGEWIEGSGNIACSHCRTIWLYRRTDFCPNCGAKMKEEADDEL